MPTNLCAYCGSTYDVIHGHRCMPTRTASGTGPVPADDYRPTPDLLADALERLRVAEATIGKLSAEVATLRIALAAARTWAVNSGLPLTDGRAVIRHGVSWVDLDAALGLDEFPAATTTRGAGQ